MVKQVCTRNNNIGGGEKNGEGGEHAYCDESIVNGWEEREETLFSMHGSCVE